MGNREAVVVAEQVIEARCRDIHFRHHFRCALFELCQAGLGGANDGILLAILGDQEWRLGCAAANLHIAAASQSLAFDRGGAVFADI